MATRPGHTSLQLALSHTAGLPASTVPWLHSEQREEAGPGKQDQSCGTRLQPPCAGRRAQQPFPGRQRLSLVYLLLPPSRALQTLIASCRSIPGPLCNLPPLPAAAASQDRSSHSLHPDSSQQDLASSPPASCLQHPAYSSAHPRVPQCGDPQAGGCAPEAPLPWGSLPARLEPQGEPSSPSQQVLEAGLALEEMPTRWHVALLPAVLASPLLGQAGLGCCVPPASPAVSWPPWGQCCHLTQGTLAEPFCSGSQQALVRHVGCLAGPLQ